MISLAKEQFVEALERLPNCSWKTGRLRGQAELVRWIPLIDLQGKGHFDGLTQDAVWVSDTKAGLAAADADHCVFVLPALEHKYEKFREKLAASLRSEGLSEELIAAFPLGPLLSEALRQDHDYWVERAFEWLRDTKLPINTQLRSVLSQLKTSKRVSQRNRQRADQMLRSTSQMDVARG